MNSQNIIYNIQKNKRNKLKLMSDLLDKYKVNVYKIINNENQINIINTIVEKVYVINLKKDRIRRNYIKVLFEKYNINYDLIIVEQISEEIYHLFKGAQKKLSKNEVGCSLSHLWCLKNMIENNYLNCIIFEDDVIFHKDFEFKFKELFNKKKIDFDFLSFGGCDFDFSSINFKNIINEYNLYQPDSISKRCYGAHANYYSLNGAKYIFKVKTLFFSFFDNNNFFIFKHFKNTAFICYPHLIVSEISTTNINHIYPFFSLNEKKYYSKCFQNFSFHDYHFIYFCLIKKMNINYNQVYDYNYKEIINNILNIEFQSIQLTREIIDRLDFEFFTMNDILKMLREDDEVETGSKEGVGDARALIL